MIYKIRYFLDGKHLADVPVDDSMGDPKKIAADGLIRHRANLAVVLNDDGSELATIQPERP